MPREVANAAEALEIIRRHGLLNQFSTRADDWWVLASEHRQNSQESEDDFLDPSAVQPLIDAGLLVPGQETLEDDTYCRSWHPVSGT